MSSQTSPLRIALLTYSTKPRGSVVHTLELATALSALGHTVCIYVLDKDGAGFERFLPCAVQLIPAQPVTQPAPSNIDALIHQRIQELVTAISQDPNHYDIYHAQDCIGANALGQLRQQGHLARIVRTVHHIEDYTSPYLRECQDRSILQPDLCLCVSDHWQQAIQAQYGVTAPRISNGVNLARFSASPSHYEAVLKYVYNLIGYPIYLTVGGIEPRKNSIALLTAFAQVLQVYPRAQLVIAGGATLFDYQPYRDQFFHHVAQLQIRIGDSLLLPGVIPDSELPALYRCAHVFCFPSLKEGWGLVVLEAIASGLPVVIPNQPPFTEFLAPDQACWVDPQSPDSIAQGIIAMSDRQQAMAQLQASQTILPNYSWQRSAERHVELYQTLIANTTGQNSQPICNDPDYQ